jgi:hypothetical protein
MPKRLKKVPIFLFIIVFVGALLFSGCNGIEIPDEPIEPPPEDMPIEPEPDF